MKKFFAIGLRADLGVARVCTPHGDGGRAGGRDRAWDSFGSPSRRRSSSGNSWVMQLPRETRCTARANLRATARGIVPTTNCKMFGFCCEPTFVVPVTAGGGSGPSCTPPSSIAPVEVEGARDVGAPPRSALPWTVAPAVSTSRCSFNALCEFIARTSCCRICMRSASICRTLLSASAIGASAASVSRSQGLRRLSRSIRSRLSRRRDIASQRLTSSENARL